MSSKGTVGRPLSKAPRRGGAWAESSTVSCDSQLAPKPRNAQRTPCCAPKGSVASQLFPTKATCSIHANAWQPLSQRSPSSAARSPPNQKSFILGPEKSFFCKEIKTPERIAERRACIEPSYRQRLADRHHGAHLRCRAPELRDFVQLADHRRHQRRHPIGDAALVVQLLHIILGRRSQPL